MSGWRSITTILCFMLAIVEAQMAVLLPPPIIRPPLFIPLSPFGGQLPSQDSSTGSPPPSRVLPSLSQPPPQVPLPPSGNPPPRRLSPLNQPPPHALRPDNQPPPRVPPTHLSTPPNVPLPGTQPHQVPPPRLGTPPYAPLPDIQPPPNVPLPGVHPPPNVPLPGVHPPPNVPLPGVHPPPYVPVPGNQPPPYVPPPGIQPHPQAPPPYPSNQLPPPYYPEQNDQEYDSNFAPGNEYGGIYPEDCGSRGRIGGFKLVEIYPLDYGVEFIREDLLFLAHCEKNYALVDFVPRNKFPIGNVTSCTSWFNSSTAYCAKGPSTSDDWLEGAIASSLTAFSESSAVACVARRCYWNSKLIFGGQKAANITTSPTTSSTTESTTFSTTYENTSLSTTTLDSDEVIFEIEDLDGIIRHLKEAYIDSLKEAEENEEEEAEALVFYSVIATSLFFSLFAVVAGFQSVIIMLRQPRTTQNKPK
ncbi:hypothetical protein OESDEN_20078 [Oesophagostomum dentatum]|uniref:Uncharacterized protein n=1 Tax=Oesophagostomum dentatum TaxID=61180 RepID=A0A0B1SAL2_OESDE|nr:hypothetical protein OESDEN_20078 [Oesophagostomum dentatum]